MFSLLFVFHSAWKIEHHKQIVIVPDKLTKFNYISRCLWPNKDSLINIKLSVCIAFVYGFITEHHQMELHIPLLFELNWNTVLCFSASVWDRCVCREKNGDNKEMHGSRGISTGAADQTLVGSNCYTVWWNGVKSFHLSGSPDPHVCFTMPPYEWGRIADIFDVYTWAST